jgi:hypothetical protein
MTTNMWPDHTGLPGTGDWPHERRNSQATGGSWPEAHPAPLTSLPQRAGGTVRPEPGLAQSWGERAPVRSCWMCGIRLPADQLVADGGSACADVRWYCLDTWGCTERWTSRPARLVAIHPGAAETAEPRGGQGPGAGTAQQVPA